MGQPGPFGAGSAKRMELLAASEVANGAVGGVTSLDLDAFGAIVAPSAPRHRAVQKLHAALVALEPGSPLTDRVDQLEAVAKWLRSSGKVPAVASAEPADRPQVSRLRLLVAALEGVPFVRERLSAVVGAVLSESSGLMLLARLGLPTDRGFWNETIDRLSRRFLPEPVDESDLAQLVSRLLPGERDAIWLSSAPDELTVRLARALDGGRGTWSALRRTASDAISLIVTRVSAIGLSDVIRTRSPRIALADSPFFKLPRSCDHLMASQQNGDPAGLAAEQCRHEAEACRQVLRAVVDNLEKYGVSVDVVYRIELVTKNLDRLEALLDLLSRSDVNPAIGSRRLLVDLVMARVKDRDIGDITRNNLHLLARKIIERAGQTGEHYITSSRTEYFKMLASAGGGGILTTGTCALKYLTAWGQFAPFVEGMLSACNYAGSFILMQFLGFTLATKQPSMTAAALAGSMRESAGFTDLTGLVSTIARITRSQLAAAIGNIGLVIPAALLFDFAHVTYVGRHFLDEHTAEYVIKSLHPTQSGTVFYAALTGVLLWLSSVGAGWLENWAVYRRLPEAIAEHRARRFLGSRLTHWASHVFAHNISGIGGNATLGVLLGMTPVMGKFFGLPLDVRHVTLSTGALTLAGCGLGAEAITSPGYLAAMGGIAIIGSLNFGVSFVLALAVALRARQVQRSDQFKLFVSVLVTFLRSPLQFLFPPSSDVAPPVHGPVSVRPPRPQH
jgi:site-specific recombinase